LAPNHQSARGVQITSGEQAKRIKGIGEKGEAKIQEIIDKHNSG
jgi:hypothetical protein